MKRIVNLLILATLGLTAGLTARADSPVAPPPLAPMVYRGTFTVPNYPQLSGSYALRSVGNMQQLVFQGAIYTLYCAAPSGPMGERSCRENVAVGYNPTTGLLQGAYDGSFSDTGDFFLGVDYGVQYVRVGTLRVR